MRLFRQCNICDAVYDFCAKLPTDASQLLFEVTQQFAITFSGFPLRYGTAGRCNFLDLLLLLSSGTALLGFFISQAGFFRGSARLIDTRYGNFEILIVFLYRQSVSDTDSAPCFYAIIIEMYLTAVNSLSRHRTCLKET